MEEQGCSSILKPLLSVIIPTLDGSILTEKCISSFIPTMQGIHYELIVVDDGSGLEELEKMRSLTSKYNCKLIELPQRNGYAKAINAGMRVSSGRYILLLNNDIYFHEMNWFHTMIQTMEEAWNIGIAGCRLLYPDSTIQHGGGALSPIEGHTHLHRGKPADCLEASLNYDVVSVTGAVMLVKREVIEEIGILCEDYPLAYEDVDYCFRARQAGWRVVYCGKAAAIHEEGSTRGRSLEEKLNKWYHEELQSHDIFWRRWANYSSLRPLSYLKMVFILSNRNYLPPHPRLVSLLHGLNEQGCQVQLRVITDAAEDQVQNQTSLDNGVIFTNDLEACQEISENQYATFNIIEINEDDWNLNPSPQDVHLCMNRASHYIRKTTD